MMQKFRFNEYTPAKVAKPANVPVNRGYPSAKPLLNFAKVDQAKQDDTATLANISNTVASQDANKIKRLSNISNISRGQGNNPVKTPQQQYDALWKKATALTDWIDDSDSTVPSEERKARVPEVQKMSMRLEEIALLINQGNEVTK